MQLPTRRNASIENQPSDTPYFQDGLLAARLRAGDEQAFADLHRQIGFRVYAFALRRLRDPIEAEDVVQDVFLQIHRSIHAYAGRSSLLTWTFGIAHHEILHRSRRRSLRTVPLGREALRVPAAASSIEDRVDASRAWRRCVESLQLHVTAPARRAFALHYLRCRSIKGIANELDKSSEAVRVALMRTRRILCQSAPALREAE